MRELAPGQGNHCAPGQGNHCAPSSPSQIVSRLLSLRNCSRVPRQAPGVIAQPWAGQSRELTASLCLQMGR